MSKKRDFWEINTLQRRDPSSFAQSDLVRMGYSAAVAGILIFSMNSCVLDKEFWEEKLGLDDEETPKCDADDETCLCENTAASAKDGSCDDGGEKSDLAITPLGTDCDDCGVRHQGDTYTYSDSSSYTYSDGTTYSDSYSDGYSDSYSNSYSNYYSNYYHEYDNYSNYYSNYYSDSW